MAMFILKIQMSDTASKLSPLLLIIISNVYLTYFEWSSFQNNSFIYTCKYTCYISLSIPCRTKNIKNDQGLSISNDSTANPTSDG